MTVNTLLGPFGDWKRLCWEWSLKLKHQGELALLMTFLSAGSWWPAKQSPCSSLAARALSFPCTSPDPHSRRSSHQACRSSAQVFPRCWSALHPLHLEAARPLLRPGQGRLLCETISDSTGDCDATACSCLSYSQH